MAAQRGDAYLREVLAKNREAAIDLSTQVGRVRLGKLLARADADLRKRISQAEGLGGPGKGSFTAEQLRVTLAQVKDVTRTLNVGVKQLVRSQGGKAADASTRHLLDYLGGAEKTFRGIARPQPLKEVAIIDQARSGVDASILRRLASSGEPGIEGAAAEPHRAKLGILQRYGMATVENFEERLQLGLLTRKPWAEVRAELVEDSPFLQGAPAHWAERIVRTETMGAYNRAGFEGIKAANEQLGDMCKILAATFDDRTSWDSYQVHGQIRRTEEAFQCNGVAYMHPPNRPNDREVVVPHRVSWPIPPFLKWKSDGEVQQRFRMEGRKGAVPARAVMTTIELAKFGRDAPPRT